MLLCESMVGSDNDLPTSAVATLDQRFSFMSRASADMLETIAEVDEQEYWRDDGATSMTSWLAGRYGVAWEQRGSGCGWLARCETCPLFARRMRQDRSPSTN